MADSKVTALAAFTPIGTDVMYGVDDPGGTPVSGKHTYLVGANAFKTLMSNEIATAVFLSNEAVVVGDGTNGIPIPAEMDGFNITDAVATVHDKGVTGATDVQIRRRRAGSDVDVLSTKITIGDEFFATDGVVNATNDDLATGDILYIDVDAIHTTAPNGLSVTITTQAP